MARVILETEKGIVTRCWTDVGDLEVSIVDLDRETWKDEPELDEERRDLELINLQGQLDPQEEALYDEDED